MSISLPAALAVMVFIYTLLFPSARLFGDPDIYWHLATGNWVLTQHQAPIADIFSYTILGRPWVDHEWLSELIMALVQSTFGLAGLRALMALLFAATIGIQARFLMGLMPPIYALLLTAISFISVLGHLIARPHVFTWLIITIWVIGLLKTNQKGWKPPYFLSLLMVLWANIHGGFILGLALIPFFGLNALLSCTKTERIEVIKSWMLFMILCTLCSIVTPYGWKSLALGPSLLAMRYTSQIIEWIPASGVDLLPIEIWLVIILGMAFFCRLKPSVATYLMLIALLHESLAHIRYVSIFGLIAPLLVAEPFKNGLAQIRNLQGGKSALDRFFTAWAMPTSKLNLALVTTALLALAAFTSPFQENRFSPAITPKQALEEIQSTGVTGNGLNHYNFGGYLIGKNIPVFIDGRADLYGDKDMGNYFDLTESVDGKKIAQELDDRKINWVLMRPNEKILLYLDQHPKEWKKVYMDDYCVAYVRIFAKP